MKDVTLALGGGGVKGHAHIGVLRALDREGLRIRAIAGTSAGGLWGSFYAAGYKPDEIEHRMKAIQISGLYGRKPDDEPAMLGLAGVEELLEETLGDLQFDDLAIPFAVTAVDIDTAQQVIIDQGRVVDAVLATIAVPGVFPPRRMDGKVLIDGGVLDPVPVALARKLAPKTPILAVVLSPAIDEWVKPTPPRLLESLPFLSTYIGRLRVAKALNVFLRSIDIGGAMLTELRLNIDQPDVIIRPAVPHIGLLDDADVSEVALLGDQATVRAMAEIRRAVGWRAWFYRRISLDKSGPVHLPSSKDFRSV
jgi:NTE family protein